MSAIVAVCRGDEGPGDIALVDAILGRMAHRAPDGRSSWTERSISLGHGLFATTPEDVATEQPLQSPVSTARIVADARLDNRDALIDELGLARAQGARWCDAELIVRAWDRWGDACPAHLLGDFAFAIWDPRHRRLFCARDPFGVRSFFYVSDAHGFRGASEMSALFADQRLREAPNLSAMATFLSEDYLERDETLYAGVRALPPGHGLVTRGREVHLAPFWRPDPWRRVRHANDEDYAANFSYVFEEAVRCRMRSQLPLAAQVSGGFDSSSVVGQLEALRRQGTGPRAPATLMHSGFPGLECDEGEFSRAVAGHWGLTVTTLLPSADPAVTRPHPSNVARDVYYHPLASLWDQQFELARARGLRVTLTGMGSDQVMRRYGQECADAIVSGSLGDAARSVGLHQRPLARASWRRVLREGIHPLLTPSMQRAVRRLRGRRSSVPRWLAPATAGIVGERRWQDSLRRRAISAPGPATRELCDALTHGYEIVFALACLASQSARNGIELRHPFYDLRLVELLLAFPHEQRCGYEEGKPVLKRAMAASLPALVRNRRRRTEFSSFVHRVLIETHGREIRALFADSRLESAAVVDGTEVRNLLKEAERDWSLLRQVANLTALELWLRQMNG
ncbi:MAG: asparagine synthase-related protein [Polyangiaceae bacterium]